MSNKSFDKNARLLSKSDFENLRSGAFVFSHKAFRVFYKKNDFCDQRSRMGVAVTRKFSNAVNRNYVKRILREEFRNSEIKTSNIDFVVVVKNNLYKQIENKSNLSEILRDSCNSLFKHLTKFKA